MGSKGGSSGGGGNTTTTTKSDPWSGQQPYLSQQFGQAQNLYDTGQLAPQYFPGQTIAAPSGQTSQAITDLTNQSNSSQAADLANANIGQVTDTLNGKYLDPSTNPYFKGTLNNIADAYARGTGAQTDAAFNRAGSYGGSAYTETTGANNKAFADSLNDLGNTQYQQGRTNQLQASALAPQANSLPYSNIAQLANAGSTLDQYNQNLINSNIQKYNYNSNLPYNSLANYIGLTGGSYGGTTTQTTPYYQNTAANTLGGAISGAVGGAGLYNAFPQTLSSLGLSPGSAGAIGSAAGAYAGYSSDMLLKENIRYAGHESGIPTYLFTYKDDPEGAVYHGVMAQEVIHTHPEAVQKVNGYYAVNYDRLGVEFRKATSTALN